MFPKRTALVFVVAAVFGATTLNSTIVRALDVASLTSQADIIVMGRVVSVTNRGATILDFGGGPIPATAFEAAIHVDQLLKGSSPAQTLFVSFAMPEMPIGVQSVVSDQYGLFFLAGLESQLSFANPQHPALPAVHNMEPLRGPLLDRVTSTLGQVLVAAHVRDADRSLALDALGSLKTDFARDTLRQALKSTSGDMHLDVARTLVARNDIAGLESVEAALLHPAGLSSNMILNLAGSLGGLKEPKSVPTLKRLIETNNPYIVKGAAIALRQSGSGDAVEPLSRLLNNSDEQVRYYAVVGMGEITRQDEWTPAFPEFREHEGKYLAYWRDWAASNIPKDAQK